MISIHPSSFLAWLRSDARHFQILAQVTFLVYGINILGWDADGWKFAAAFAGSLGMQVLAVALGLAPMHSLKSALITSLGLSLLFKSASPWLFLLAGIIAISQKFVFRIRGKHLWNPAAIGIVATILISGEAWVSPGQWGSAAVLVFIIGTAGLAVLSRCNRLDTGIAFILTFAALEYSRTVLYLGWDHGVFLHKLSNGSLWLFSFFMITDPMTTPDSKKVRIVWSILVAAGAFYLSAFRFLNATPLWVLVFATPLSPLLDLLFKGERFQWQVLSPSTPLRKAWRTALPLFALALLIPVHQSFAFCGFYVAKADATLFNNKSEVILVRDGTRTVITMSNDFKGDVRDFAMVVPVPVVLQEGDIRIVNRRVFESLDAYSAPRLVEYYDSNPCYIPEVQEEMYSMADMVTSVTENTSAPMPESKHSVTIEARYSVGEYDILILSALESEGLRDWLIENGYRIPSTADEVLEPYIRSNTKFFVAKINLDRIRQGSYEYLNPLQISFDHAKFMLPIRLGMANSTGVQDMIVYAFTKSGRVECTNYRTVKVPTDRNIPLFVQSRFGEFYRDLFEKTWRQEGRNSVMLEYAWNVTPNWGGMKCDPCVGPPPIHGDLVEAGVWWINDWNNPANVFFTRLHVRYGRDRFPADLTFQVTPNSEHFQARYILTHPAGGPFDCAEGQDYLSSLHDRRSLEVSELYALTGKSDPQGYSYMTEYDRYMVRRPDQPRPGSGRGPSPMEDDGSYVIPVDSSGQSGAGNENGLEDFGFLLPGDTSSDQADPGDSHAWWVSLGFILASLGILMLSRKRVASAG